MIRTKRCPACKGGDLQIFKNYQFVLPEAKEYNKLTGDLTYDYEKLWIFFEKIWNDKSPAEIDATLCTSCGLIFTNPRFTEEEIKTKYQIVGELESAKKRRQKFPASKTDERAERIYKLLSKLRRNELKLQKVLDYGGGEGYNLLPFIQAGNSCYLTDYVKKDYSEGVNYSGRDVCDLKDDERFDVILFCHTLEHVIEPKRILSDLVSHLAEGGMLYVEVPLGSFREWQSLREPLTHVNFFSEEAVFKCLRSVGLDIIHLSTAYQWVTHSKMCCINIVGSKQKGNTITKFRTTQQQMQSPNQYYYLKQQTKKVWKSLGFVR